jgi:hypothetical protein
MIVNTPNNSLNTVVVPSLYLRFGVVRRALDTGQTLRRFATNFE